jgi:hypothetical protein
MHPSLVLKATLLFDKAGSSITGAEDAVFARLGLLLFMLA